MYYRKQFRDQQEFLHVTAFNYFRCLINDINSYIGIMTLGTVRTFRTILRPFQKHFQIFSPFSSGFYALPFICHFGSLERKHEMRLNTLSCKLH